MSLTKDHIWEFPNFWPGVSSILFALCVYQASITIYYVFIHPLAKFPGPKFAAASNIPYARALAGGRLPQWIKSLHDQYNSDVVRTSPTELSFISPGAWRDINGYRVGHKHFEKDPAVNGKPSNGVDHLVSANQADHSRMRRTLDHAFSVKASREQEPTLVAFVDRLISRLHEQVNGQSQGKVDVFKWYNWMSFDVIGDLAFGETFGCLEDEKYHPWVALIFANLEGLAFKTAGDRFPVFRYLLPLLIPKRIKRMIVDHDAFTAETVNRRIELGTERADFMSPILKYNGTEKGLTREEMHSNASLFIVAGSESVATVSSGATYYLLKHPAAMKKLQEEVSQAFATGVEINVQSVAKLPYLLAVLNETMRLYPVALTGQSCIVPAGGDTVCDLWLPANTGVSINQYAAYHSAANFEFPESFIPERWLEPEKFSDRKEIFNPFSIGPANCIGKILAEEEIRLILAKMIWNFNIQLDAKTDDDWLDQKVFFTWQKKPLFVRLNASGRT